MKSYGRKQETDQVGKGREVKGGKCEGDAAAGEEGERELDSLMWLLWPGSRLLHLHFRLKIAPVIIYSVGRAHPVLCSRDHCSRPVTGDTPRVSRCLAVIWMCDILCFCLISLPVSLPKKAAVSSSCLGVLVHPDL